MTATTAGSAEIRYFDFFGGAKQVGDRGAGYYSYTLGNWHIIALNSNVPATSRLGAVCSG